MFWPFGLNSSNQLQYINSLQNLCPSFFPNDFASNQLLNAYATGFYNFPPNYPSFVQNDAPLNLSNVLVQSNRENLHENSQIPMKENFPNVEENSSSKQEKSKKSSSSSEGSIRLVRFRRRRKVNREKNKISHNSSLRNDTKNIPKNYGKAMLAYIQKNTKQLKQLLSEHEVDFMEFMMVIKEFRTKINTIHDLREMWGEDAKEDKIRKCIRILSYHFMRKQCLPYIFNSRVKNYHIHIKYRKKIMQGIADPEKFTKIKQF